jgi:prepilin-type N-terminal cleavage/methylation domain-containing protein
VLRLPDRRDDGGFTLVELLVVIVLIGIVGAVTTTGLVQSMRASQRAQDRTAAFNELEIAMERLTRELRAADPIISISPTDVIVRVERGGTCQLHRYTHTGTEVRYGTASGCTATTTSATTRIVEDVQNTTPTGAVFRYLTQAQAAQASLPEAHQSTVTDVEDVAAIWITLVREIPGQQDVRVSSVVNVRNFS